MQKKNKKSKSGVSVPLAIGGAGLLALGIYSLVNRSSSAGIDTTTTDSTQTTTNPVPKKNEVTRNYIVESFPLKKGMKGPSTGWIGRLQWNLNKLGAPLKPDGVFGPDTEKALVKLGYDIVVTSAGFDVINAKAQEVVKKSIKVITPYDQLLAKNYKRSNIDMAINLRNVITNKTASEAITFNGVNKILFNKNINDLKDIINSYKFLYNSRVMDDLAALKNGRFRFNSVLNQIQPLSGVVDISKRLVTTRPTLVKGKHGTAPINVPANILIGTFLGQSKGITVFKDLKGQLFKAFTADLKEV